MDPDPVRGTRSKPPAGGHRGIGRRHARWLAVALGLAVIVTARAPHSLPGPARHTTQAVSPDGPAGADATGLGLILAGTLTAALVTLLARRTTRLKRSEASLAALNAELDRRVEERTAAVRAAAEAERRSAELLQGLFDESPFAVIGLDAEQRVMLWNAAAERLFGYSAAEVMGQPPPHTVAAGADQTPTSFQAMFDRTRAGERLRRVEVTRRRRDGAAIDLLLSTIPLSTTGRTFRGAVGLFEDVTDQKRVAEQLLHAQKLEAVGQLTGGLAHDFNNLLAVMIGNLDLLADRVQDDAASRRLVDNTLDAALRGAQLTRQLLAFARRQPLQPQPVALNVLVAELGEVLHRALGETIKVNLSLASDLWPAQADPTQVQSALLNLAVNARDAMPHGGQLNISTANQHLDEDYTRMNPEVIVGDYVMLSVSDTGVGMGPDLLAKVFDPFFTTKEAGKCSGLGLSMVYGFAKQSGGHLKLYSEEGHGTMARLYLPRDRSERLPAEVVVGEAPEVELGRGEKILLVEDNATVRLMVAQLLEDTGYEVYLAGDGVEALEVLDQGHHVDLLFTDIVMPGGLSGPELAREARARRPGLKVLFTSGFTDPGGLPGGARIPETLLVKPYRRSDLARMLRQVLG